MLSGYTDLSPMDVLQTYVPSYTQDVPGEFGMVGQTSDGRRFKLGFNATASTTLASNKNTQGPVQLSQNNLGTVSAQSIGDTFIVYTFTGGAQTTTLNQYQGGYVSIVTGTGSIQQLQIKSSPVVTSSTTITLQLTDPVYIATAATATANIWQAPYSAVIICPTTLTGTVTGVPLVAIPGQAYGWFQTAGLATVLGQGATTQGLDMAIGSVAGSFAVAAATTQRLATADMAGADGLYTIASLKIG